MWSSGTGIPLGSALTSGHKEVTQKAWYWTPVAFVFVLSIFYTPRLPSVCCPAQACSVARVLISTVSTPAVCSGAVLPARPIPPPPPDPISPHRSNWWTPQHTTICTKHTHTHTHTHTETLLINPPLPIENRGMCPQGGEMSGASPKVIPLGVAISKRGHRYSGIMSRHPTSRIC